ncbi:MAG: hypothetical protein GY716_15160 [bacterium]|nr:hypothetical protein [bacterium]
MRARIVLLAAIVAVAGTVVSSEETGTVTVEFYDSAGNLLTGLDVVASTDTSSERASASDHPDGVYEFVASPGGKITFRASGRIAAYNPHIVLLPQELSVATVQIRLYQQGGQNLCQNAAEVNLGDVAAGDTTGAGVIDPEQTDGGFCGTEITEGGRGLWYDLTVSEATTVTFSTCNDGNPATGSAEFDTKISVFCRDCEDLDCINGNDDGVDCANWTSSVTFCVEENATHHILVHGFNGATGPFELAIVPGEPCPAEGSFCNPVPPLPLTGACCFDNCDELTAAGASEEVFTICADFDCQVLEEDECLLAGGAYQGDDAPCIVMSDASTVFSSSPNLPIFDNDPTGVSDEIVVSEDGRLIGDLDVALVLTHPWIGDLRAALTHVETGTEVVLWNRNCGDDSLLDIVSDDEGTQWSCGNGEPTTGSIPPALTNGFTSFLSDFDLQTIDGTWSLFVDDENGGFTGWLTSWSLILREGTTVCPSCPSAPPTTLPDPPGPDEDSESGADAGAFRASGRRAASESEGLLELDEID